MLDRRLLTGGFDRDDLSVEREAAFLGRPGAGGRGHAQQDQENDVETHIFILP